MDQSMESAFQTQAVAAGAGQPTAGVPGSDMMASMGGGQMSSGSINTGFDTPPVEIKLFVGRVPRTADEETLTPIFAEFGPVLEVAIIKDKATQNHKGSAFVRMASLTHADAAVRTLNNVKVLDPALGALQVRYATGEAEKLGLSAENANPGADQAKLFVGSLPKHVTDEDVRQIFASFGSIDEVFVMKDSVTGQGKGCAFVKLAYKEQAIHAIKSLNGIHTVSGAPRAIEVRFAESKKAASPLPGGAGVGVVPGAVGAMGMMPRGPSSNLNPRQAGPWKEYFTPDGRAYYHNEVTQQTQWDRPVDFDQPSARQPDITGPPGANIFIFHVPNHWSQQDLVNHFGPYGNILSARVATDRATGRNKGYAFVSYDNVNSAVQAVHHMNGFLADGKRLKVSIKQHEEKYANNLMPSNQSPGGQGPPMSAPGQMGIPASGMPGMAGSLTSPPHSHPHGGAGMTMPAGAPLAQTQGAYAAYGGYGSAPAAPHSYRHTPY